MHDFACNLKQLSFEAMMLFLSCKKAFYFQDLSDHLMLVFARFYKVYSVQSPQFNIVPVSRCIRKRRRIMALTSHQHLELSNYTDKPFLTNQRQKSRRRYGNIHAKNPLTPCCSAMATEGDVNEAAGFFSS